MASLNPRPCPCCGSSDLTVGNHHTAFQGVRCCACGLSMDVESFDTARKWPKGVYDEMLDYHDNVRRLREHLRRKAVAKWNRRAAVPRTSRA